MAGLRVRCIDTRPYLSETAIGLRVEASDGEMVSLTRGKLYDVLEQDDEFYRIVDDTGEDYLYPKSMFERVAESGP